MHYAQKSAAKVGSNSPLQDEVRKGGNCPFRPLLAASSEHIVGIEKLSFHSHGHGLLLDDLVSPSALAAFKLITSSSTLTRRICQMKRKRESTRLSASENGQRSSHTSSRRAPLKMLLTITTCPLT